MKAYSSFQTSTQYVNEDTLFRSLTILFHSDQIIKGVRKNIHINHTVTDGKYMEFDFWIPKHKLCFEFQDPYHFVPTWYSQLTVDFVSSHDSTKVSAAHKYRLSLISIPCWWNGSLEGLTSTILFQRPDLPLVMEYNSSPISLNPPLGYFDKSGIPNMGELMLASFPTQASAVQYNKWWLGEKYDGIRSCWDPTTRAVYTRQGLDIELLPCVTSKLPPIFLDGELWFGRGQYNIAQHVGSSNAHWDLLRLITFDVPTFKREKYEDRYRLLLSNIPSGHPFNYVAPRMECKNTETEWFLQMIVEESGEGLILQRQGSKYENGRSQSLLKLKSTSNDQEGIVIGFGSDQSVVLKLPNNTTFAVPFENVLTSELTKGDIVSFSCDNNLRLTAPINAKIFRVRSDLLWEDVVHNFHHGNQLSHIEKPIMQVSSRIKDKKGHWTLANIRLYMENFAKRRNLDPLKLETWQKHKDTFLKLNSSKWIVRKFKNSYIGAIQRIFPEIAITPLPAEKFYHKIENRYKFFESYAAQEGFDPLYVANWYSQPKEKILASKGAAAVMRYYKDNLIKGLLDVFPNINFDRTKFQFSQRFWHTAENRRKFFESYADANNFDPLLPENWYTQHRKDVVRFKGGYGVLEYYKQILPEALVALFPDIGLDISKFRYWKYRRRLKQ